MTITSDLYAIPSNDLEALKTLIEKVLQIQFVRHESDSLGGNYYRFKQGEGELILHFNRDAIDDEFIDDRYPHCGLLFHVEEMSNYQEIEKILKEKIPGIILVERDQV